MTKQAAGDVRKLSGTAAVWNGKSRASKTHGVHAVGELQTAGPNVGARFAICGLVGRFLVDEKVTAGTTEFIKVAARQRCSVCHTEWLAMAGGDK